MGTREKGSIKETGAPEREGRVRPSRPGQDIKDIKEGLAELARTVQNLKEQENPRN